MTQKNKYQILLSRILNLLSYHPIREIKSEIKGTLSESFVCHVSNNDIGLLCGKDAVVIKAIQLIFRFIGHKLGMKYFGVFLRATGNDFSKLPKRKEGWNQDEVIDLTYSIIDCCGHEIIHSEIVNDRDCVGLRIEPPLPEPLFMAIHTVIEHIGKSYGKCFGLSRNENQTL